MSHNLGVTSQTWGVEDVGNLITSAFRCNHVNIAFLAVIQVVQDDNEYSILNAWKVNAALHAHRWATFASARSRKILAAKSLSTSSSAADIDLKTEIRNLLATTGAPFRLVDSVLRPSPSEIAPMVRKHFRSPVKLSSRNHLLANASLQVIEKLCRDPSTVPLTADSRSSQRSWENCPSLRWTDFQYETHETSVINFNIPPADSSEEAREWSKVRSPFLYLLPTGILAKDAGAAPEASESYGNHSFVASKDVDATWKEVLQAWLMQLSAVAARLISDENGQWILVQPILRKALSSATQLDHSRNVLWPASLCFPAETPDQLSQDSMATSVGETHYFQPNAANMIMNGDDPFQYAEDWIERAADRQQQIQQAKRDTEMRDLDATHMQNQAVTMDASNYSSPAYFRSDLQPQASAVYPTPPDGINLSGIVQPLDSETATAVLSDHALTGAMNDQDVVLDDVEPTTPLAIGDETEPTEDYDDLFDDDQNEEMNDTGLTDADFNYFDTPSNPTTNQFSSDEPIVLEESSATISFNAVRGGEERSEIHAEFLPVGPSTHFLDEHVMLNDASTIDGVDGLQAAQTPSPQANNHPKSGNGKEVSFLIVDPVEQRPRTRPLHDTPSRRLQAFPTSENGADRSFLPIDFGQRLSRSDAKYGVTGRFGFKVDVTKANQKVHDAKTAASPTNPKNSHSLYMSDEMSDSETSDSSSNEDAREDHMLRRDLGIFGVDTPPEHPLKTAVEGMARQWTAAEVVRLLRVFNKRNYVAARLKTTADAKMKPKPRIKSPMTFMHQLQALEESLSDNDCAAIANLVADQLVYSLDAIPRLSGGADQISREINDPAASMRQSICDLLGDMFDTRDSLTLHDLANAGEPVQENNVSVDMGKDQKRTLAEGLSTAVFEIPSGQVRLQRAGASLEIAPLATTFWEANMLSPANGPKRILSFCLYSFNEETSELLNQFMHDMSITFHDCRLGTHLTGLSQGTSPISGLIPVFTSGETQTAENGYVAFYQTCRDLAHSLAKQISADQSARHSTVLIYLLNPFEHAEALMFLCACFHLMRNEFQNAIDLSEMESPVDLTLKVLPSSVVTNYERASIANPNMLRKLATEIYDRCPGTDTALDTAGVLESDFAPFVRLVEAFPRSIPFRVAAAAPPASDLLHDNACLHVAYAFSHDKRWCTACWTDKAGKSHATSTVCVLGRALTDAIVEVWRSTVHLMATRKIRWRVFVMRHGLIAPDELRAWETAKLLIPAYNRYALTLIALDVNPPFEIYSPIADPGGSWPPPSPGPPQTPAATSGLHIHIPDPSATGPHSPNAATTPSTAHQLGFADVLVEQHPSATLHDPHDDTWAALLPFAPRVSSLAASGPAIHSLASAYLLRRGSPDQHALCNGSLPVVALHLLYARDIDGNEHSHVVEDNDSTDGTAAHPPDARKYARPLLKEAMVMCRGLAVLARLRGVTKGLPKEGLVPVHVGWAMRAAAGLSDCMTG